MLRREICTACFWIIAGLVAKEVASDPTCSCFDDFSNATVQAQLSSVTPIPLLDYQYLGVISTTNGYAGCACRDVTRVKATLKVTESFYVTGSSDASKRGPLAANISQAIKDQKAALETNSPILQGRLHEVFVTYKSTAADHVLFDLDFVFKGYNDNIASGIQGAFPSVVVNSKFPGIGSVDTASMQYTVRACTGDPPAAPTDGFRDWNNKKLAGVVVTYGCNSGLMPNPGFSVVTQCSHATSTWTTSSTRKCTKGCSGSPPNPYRSSLQARYNWDKVTTTEGTVVTYYCIRGYSPYDGKCESNGTVPCTNGTWVEFDFFNCTAIPCGSIPQVPVFGQTNWNGYSDIQDTKITYFCIGDRVSLTGTNPVITCDNGKWSSLPAGWRCITKEEAEKLGTASVNTTPEPDDDPSERPIVEEYNLFLWVTMPSVAGLTFVILCCLCCTRTDCPLSRLCSRRRKSKPGIP